MGASLSPMMTHYVEVKEQNSRGLLFYRVGDFYELFFDDARRAAELLDLTCTSRQNHGGEPIPMAGVPHHALQTYVDRCLAQGVSAVICDQLEDAALAKGMVKRGVTRIETPGTVVQEDQPDQVFLAAIAPPERAKDRWGLALLDLGCADFRCSDFGSLEETLEEVRRFDAKELIFPEDLEFQASAFQGALVPLDRGWFRRKGSAEQIQDFLSVHDLAAFGLSDRPDRVAAAAAASRYARSTRSGEFNHIHVLKSYERSDRLHLDGATLRNLEVFFTLSGQRDGGLLKTLDRCATPGGKRALAESLRAPLLNPTEIEARLDRCEVLLRDHGLRSAVRDHLRRVGDLERIASRLALGGGNPRQLRVLANGLNSLPELAILLQSSETMHQWFMSKWQPLESDLRPLAVELNLALVERPPVRRGDGDSVADGYDPKLDQARNLARHSAEAIESFAAAQIEATGIPTLKVKQNKVFGYFIEVSNRYTDKVPEHYRRKQTIATGERYINDELDGLAERIQAAETESDALEAELFHALRDRAARLVSVIFEGAQLLAELDLASCFAELADRHGYVRPEILPPEDHVVELRASRHPVVERNTTEPFVANDIALGKGGKRLIILTGPNMGGKSTLMRQVALSVLMGQAGCFVPAESARFALRDRIFTRVGASDDLSQGRSTFMVEMTETANILHHATEKSLVILDEIGRGTATFDGLSLAWSVAEDLHDRVKALGLFATHYHELCELASSRAHVINMQVAVREWSGDIVFMRQLEPGGASRSYGIQVARLAGLPPEVIGRARELLLQLEMRQVNRGDHPTIIPKDEAPKSGNQLSLFGGPPPAQHQNPAVDEILRTLTRVDPMTTTPMQALRILERLRRKLLD
ncbi:MAG: DNA mismatch repair protein MutS [Myxococcales bacterium]|nr:DNA mismatch repair protein MutS [Myxococcales bacterium]